MTHDYSQHQPRLPNKLAAEIASLVLQHKEATLRCETAEEELKRAKAQLAYIAEEVLPEKILELGTDIYRDPTTGLEIRIEQAVFANISEANKPYAFAWMDANGHGGMIKREITVAFNRDQEIAARTLQDKLIEEGYPSVQEKGTVHWKTLSSWAKGQLEDGVELPDSISIHRKPVAKIK